MELSELEQQLVDAVIAGELIDLDADSSSFVDWETMQRWGPEREVRADVIRDLLRGRLLPDGEEADPRGIRLLGARIVGRLDLDNLTTAVPLDLGSCHLTAGLTAQGATLAILGLSGATFGFEARPALDADGATITGDVFLNGITADGSGESGAVRLLGAQIGGQLSMRGATVANGAGPALAADRATITGGVFLDGRFTADGSGEGAAVRLLGAQIGGQLSMRGATVANGAGPALAADGATIAEDVLLNDFTANGNGERGALRLPGAQIGGQLSMTGATVDNDAGPALAADRATTSGSVFLNDGFTATGSGKYGAVRLLGAQIGGQLSMRGATVTNDAGPALNADQATITGGVFLDEGFTATGSGEDGAVRLPAVKVQGTLVVDAGAVAAATAQDSKWVVDGLTFPGYPTRDLKDWLRLLQHGTTEYAAQPYQQLAANARAAGHEREARIILMTQRADRIRRGSLSRPEKAWEQFTGLLLGYGYQPWRAALVLLGVFVAALVLVFTVGAEGLAHTDKAQPATLAVGETGRADLEPGTPCSSGEKVRLAIDMSIPLVATDTATTCWVTPTPEGTWITWAAGALQLLSWALLALFTAGFTNIIRKP
jgi:hypothetical protein